MITVSEVCRAQIVGAAASAHVNPRGRGAYFVSVGIEGIEEA